MCKGFEGVDIIEWFVIIAAIIALTVWQFRLVSGMAGGWIFIWLIFGFFTVTLPKTNFLIGMASVLFSVYSWTMLIALVLVPHFQSQKQRRQINYKTFILLLLNYLLAVPRIFQLLDYHELTFWPLLEAVTKAMQAVNLTMLILALLWVLATAVVASRQHQSHYIVILGAALVDGQPGPILAERLKKGLSLAKQDPSAKVVVTGGGPDEHASQAAVMADCLINDGLDRSRLLVEPTANNTRENLARSLELIKKDGGQGQSVLIVTSNFHLFRTWTYARQLSWRPTMAAAKTPGGLLPLAGLRDFLGVLRDHFLAFVIILIMAIIAAIF